MNISFSIQRNIGFETVVDVGYVGSLGRHLTWQRDINSIPLGTRFLKENADPTSPSVPLADVFLRPIVGYNGINYQEAAGSSNYHSLRRPRTGGFPAASRSARPGHIPRCWTSTMANSAL
jgi:hypothetical protein